MNVGRADELPSIAPISGCSGARIPSIGASCPRIDAFTKVTGREKFASDYYAEEFVWAGVKRAGIPHAKLKSIEVRTARNVSGVLCVLTHADVRGTNRHGVVRKDQPVLVDDKIRHCGDAVALVVARDKDALQQALHLITFDCEPLRGIFDPEEAMGQDSPPIHEGVFDTNIVLDGELVVGRGSAAEIECDVLVEDRFQTQGQEHAYLETESGWAQVDIDGKLTVVCSTQAPFRDRAEIAEALGIEIGKIRIVAPYAGGAFGGKDGVTVQNLLALAALHSGGLPVKMCWSREESFVAGTKRHPARLYFRLGAKKDGCLHYLDARIYLDTGPYDHLGGVVLAQALEHAGGPYRIPNAFVRGWCVYTNNPVGGAFRGFGATQATAAIEQLMDILAVRLGIDPLDLRLKNTVRAGDKSYVGKTLTGSTGVTDCLLELARHEFWSDRVEWKKAAARFKNRGIGVAAIMQAMGYGPVVPDYANAKVELTREGNIRVYCGVVDMGQGNTTANMQIAGFLLRQAPHSMEFVQPDTDRTLPSCSASASRCTYTYGNALIGACEILRKRILSRAADLLMASRSEGLALVPGAVRCMKTSREITLSDLANMLSDSERTAVSHFRAETQAESVTSDWNLALHGLPHTLFSYAAHLAAVEVDELTGAVNVLRYLTISDCGTVMNPQLYEQQIQGGISQGIGYALYEDLLVDNGKIINPNFTNYVLPSTRDLPDVKSIALGLFEPSGPFGLKGVGEISTNGPLPAVANAIADACGVRIMNYPMRLDRVLMAIEKRKSRGQTD